jgi:AAA15 family ATPase/GTPase
MVASKERQHPERVPKLEKYRARILPIAAIYGGNASGKTNFFRALHFAKTLIADGTRPDSLIPVEPFLLDDESEKKPSRFEFELLIDKTIYAYSFAVTQKAVLEEKLVKINGSSESVLFDRHGEKLNFHSTLEKNKFLDFAFRSTRSNQLFLTNSVALNIDKFKPVHDWFKDTLVMIAPNFRFGFPVLMDKQNPLSSSMNRIIPLLDTGVSRFGGEAIQMDSVPMPKWLKSDMMENIKEGMSANYWGGPGGEYLLISRTNGELVAKRLVAYHLKPDGSEVGFIMGQESDGTKRLLELLPIFLDLATTGSERVFVIDEVDRSLHTMLLRDLIEAYLGSCSPESRSQLLLTTHDVLLMDQDILRRDEMWVTERDATGASNLTSFGEYMDIRYDKDIRKSYLQGRLGGIPRLLLDDFFSGADITQQSGEGA